MTTPKSCRTLHPDALAALDELVQNASRGDARAIGAIAVAFGPPLYDEAAGRCVDPAEALQDLLVALSTGRLTFHPPTGRHVTWLRAVVRTFERRKKDRLAASTRPSPNLSLGEPAMKETQLDRLYRRHVRALCNLANRIVQNPDDAEDIVHDAFVVFAEAAGDIVATDAAVLARLEATVIRLCHEHLHDAARRSSALRIPTPPTPIMPMAVLPRRASDAGGDGASAAAALPPEEKKAA